MSKGKTDLTDLQAAEWIVRLEDRERPTTAREQSEFFAWLMRSTENVKTFLAMADLSRVLDGMDAGRRLDIEKLFQTNRVTAMPLHAGLSLPSQPPPRLSTARNMRVAAFAGVLLIAFSAIVGWRMLSDSASYGTATGEQRTVQLSDGSVLNLNARSRVSIHFSKAARQVELLEGEALFSVEHDPSRPFSVITSNATIRAVGTQFNVYRRQDGTTVSVVEGAVQVTPDGAPSAARLFKAGEQATIGDGATVKLQSLDIHDALAWRERRLVFENASLGEVIAEFNRYNAIQLRAMGALATTKRLTATFSADKPQSLLHYLEEDPALVVERKDDSVRIRLKSDLGE